MMESLSSLLRLGCIHKRPLQREFSKRFNQSKDNWNKKIQTTHWLHQARLHNNGSTPLGSTNRFPSPPSSTIFTDASEKGWGAHMDSLTT